MYNKLGVFNNLIIVPRPCCWLIIELLRKQFEFNFRYLLDLAYQSQFIYILAAERMNWSDKWVTDMKRVESKLNCVLYATHRHICRGAGERRFYGSIAFHLPFTAHKSIERKQTNFFWLFIIGSIKGAEREERRRGLADKLMDYLPVDTNALLPRLRKAVESTLSIPPIRFQ